MRQSGGDGRSGSGRDPERLKAEDTGSVRRSLRIVVIGGCLAMVYGVGVGSPATTEFFRSLGANEFHFGLITGLPLAMLLLQFVGAAALNHAHRRKGVFVSCLVASRLLYLPLAALPWLVPGETRGVAVWLAVALLALSGATHNFAIPFWYSWMADLVPRRALNRVWGWRQRAMHITWTAAYLLVTLLLHRLRWPALVVFPALSVLAIVAGITDVMLFLGVREPPNVISPERFRWRDLLAPMKHPTFSRFVLFSCAWSFATACAANFMQLYSLKVLGVAPWLVALIWCAQGVGMALASGMWGRLADRHGHRPVINICVSLKPMIVIVYILLTPSNVLWLLPLAFVPDGMLNSGYALAANGYMLSIAPRINRSMFIAAITGLAGVCGGISAMLAGVVLTRTQGWSMDFLGRTWNHYHLIFATSLVLRLVCQPLARRIREPGATRSSRLLLAMMDEWPLSFLRFPVGLFRR